MYYHGKSRLINPMYVLPSQQPYPILLQKMSLKLDLTFGLSTKEPIQSCFFGPASLLLLSVYIPPRNPS